MTAFVILHYRAIDTTRSCVKSIRALAGDKHIVIWRRNLPQAWT